MKDITVRNEFDTPITTMQDYVDYLKIHKNSIAVEYEMENKKFTKTYINLTNDIERIAKGLIDIGIEKKHIALIGRASYEWIAIFYGIMCSGNVIVLIDKELDGEEIGVLIKKADVDFIVCDKELEGKVSTSGINVMDIQRLFLTTFESKKKQLVPLIISCDYAAIFFTSGTTGNNKCVALTHENLISDMLGCNYLTKRTKDDVIMTILPLHHALEIMTGIQVPLYVGMKICILNDLRKIIPAIKKFKPTILVLVPAIVENIHKRIQIEIKNKGYEKKLNILTKLMELLLILHIDVRNKVFSRIRESLGGRLDTIICGGAFLDNQYIHDFNKWGISVCNGYGLTECSPVVSCNLRNKHIKNSVGRVLPQELCQVKVVENEIWVRGKIVADGYYNDSDATKESFYDGWFKTGDLGRVDRDGNLFIVGRRKNLIVLSNGENIVPEELEQLLCKIPEVLEVLVTTSEKNQLCAKIFPNIDLVNGLNQVEIEKCISKKIEDINKKLPQYKKIYFIDILNAPMNKNSLGKMRR